MTAPMKKKLKKRDVESLEASSVAGGVAATVGEECFTHFTALSCVLDEADDIVHKEG